MNILVTGANGLLATHLIKDLLNEGHTVKGLLRSPEKFQLPPHENLTLVKADINELPELQNAVHGCEVVIHAAAIANTHLPSYKPYHKTNVLGTKNVVTACINQQVRRLVFVSTANTIGYGILTHPGYEALSAAAPFTENHYVKSKLKAEKLVLKAVREKNLDAVIVNPTFMIGAYGSTSGSTRIISMAGKKTVFCPPGGKNFVNAEDVSQGIIKAVENGVAGEKYLLCGENLSYQRFFKLMKKMTGKPKNLIAIPAWILFLAGTLGNILILLNIKTDLSLNNMKILCVKNYYSSRKAKNQLGANFREVKYGIIAARKWLKQSVIED